MDKISLIELNQIKFLILEASSVMVDDPKAKDYALGLLNKAICKVHDMETTGIKQLNLGTLSAGA
jgi:hypothetical protein